jgi:hypothetical protein
MDELACAFNISGLRSLKLHNCPYSSALLEATVDSSQAIKTHFLELVVDEEDECFGSRGKSVFGSIRRPPKPVHTHPQPRGHYSTVTGIPYFITD